jgi:hypothetical protein
MKTDALLAQLQKVKATGRGRWIACCPAHEDRTPSLTIAEGDDGRVLIHCFSGCDVGSVVGAVGMTLSDLMPDAPIAQQTRRVRIPALVVLRAMKFPVASDWTGMVLSATLVGSCVTATSSR